MNEPSDVRERLADLEERVAALEGPQGPTGQTGTVSYAGRVRLHGEVGWQIEYDAAAVLDLPPAAVVRVLAALGHAVRLQLVHRLVRGPATVAELTDAVGGSSSGQVYHHLTTLTAAGVVEAQGAGRYRVPATGVVPVLVALLAAGDLAGALR